MESLEDKVMEEGDVCEGSERWMWTFWEMRGQKSGWWIRPIGPLSQKNLFHREVSIS